MSSFARIGFGTSAGPWELVEEIEVVNPVASVNFSGLNGNAGFDYMVRGQWTNVSTVPGIKGLFVYPNGGGGYGEFLRNQTPVETGNTAERKMSFRSTRAPSLKQEPSTA